MSERWPCDCTNAPGDDLVICRCEEVSLGEIKAALENGMVSVSGVKRATRAGMGLCQGQSCGRQVAGIVSRHTGRPLAEVPPMTARPPARPAPMQVLARDKYGEDFQLPTTEGAE